MTPVCADDLARLLRGRPKAETGTHVDLCDWIRHHDRRGAAGFVDPEGPFVDTLQPEHCCEMRPVTHTTRPRGSAIIASRLQFEPTVGNGDMRDEEARKGHERGRNGLLATLERQFQMPAS